MKQFTHRLATAAATLTVAGSALIAVGNPAAAATPTADRHSHTGAVARVATDHSDRDRPRTDVRRDWRSDRDHRDYLYWRASDDGRQLRYDGRHVHQRVDGRWIVLTPAGERAYGFDRWYFDQLWDSYAASSRSGI
ncbi:hypothetical protein [Streptomyces sp. NPDC059862]|uniref:hypothetical protein n=1 Tax=unclassified Streptomyces TaxID=2593676 RepID=UPI003628A4E1